MSSYGDFEVIMLVRTPQDIGALLREHRQKAGLDQAELAKRVGVSRQWLVEVEGGKPRAEVGLVLRALNVLNIPLEVGTSRYVTGIADTPEIDIDAIVDAARKPR
jgi:HTH-type transcriptional regulator/antitoxin HipB